jgi:RNA-dependent RNA polymerase
MINFRSMNQASSRIRIALSGRIETALENIYRKHNLTPINDETRQRLSSIPENLGFELVRKVFSLQAGLIYNLDSFIVSRLTKPLVLLAIHSRRTLLAPLEDTCPGFFKKRCLLILMLLLLSL